MANTFQEIKIYNYLKSSMAQFCIWLRSSETPVEQQFNPIIKGA